MLFYVRVVWQAVLAFPFAAAVIALPFLIHHYRKYGCMTFAHFFLSYSFVLYALCAYFLVILPLPTREEVAQMTGPTMQLIPFSFFRDLSKETGFQLNQPSTYLPALFFEILPDGSYEGTERLMGQCWLTGCGYFAAAAALGWALFRRRDID